MEQAKEKMTIETYRCNTCRVELTSKDVTKIYIDYTKDENGNLVTLPARYSVFCANCKHFLCIVDPEAAAQVNKIASKNKEIRHTV